MMKSAMGKMLVMAAMAGAMGGNAPQMIFQKKDWSGDDPESRRKMFRQSPPALSKRQKAKLKKTGKA